MSKDIEKKIRQTFLDSISVKKEIVDNDLDLVLLEAVLAAELITTSKSLGLSAWTILAAVNSRAPGHF